MHGRVRAAVEELCPGRNGGLPDARRLGWKLRSLEGRVIAGKVLERDDQGSEGLIWTVVPASSDAVAENDEAPF